MLPLTLGLVVVLWFVFGRFLSRKTNSVAIGYSVGLLAALMASIFVIANATNVRDYVVQRNADSAGFASVQEYRQAQRLGHSTKASYDQARAEYAAARRSAEEAYVRLQEETAADERRRQRLKMLNEATPSSRPAARSGPVNQPATPSRPTRSFSDLEHNVRTLLARGEGLNRNNPSTCVTQMRTLQPQAKALRAQINQLPGSTERVWLGTAATAVNLCVSCERTLGPQHCAIARDALNNLR